MSIITRTLMLVAAEHLRKAHQECQFSHAILTLASEAAFLVPDDPQQAMVVFQNVLQEMARVKYYRPKTPRPSHPRINKQPINNKWNRRNRQRLPNGGSTPFLRPSFCSQRSRSVLLLLFCIRDVAEMRRFSTHFLLVI